MFEDATHENLAGDNVRGYKSLNLDECQNLSGITNEDYETDQIMGDMVKVEVIDENSQGEVNRGGIWINQDTGTRLWRIGRIVKRGALAAPELQEGVLVRYPSDRGIPCVSAGKKYIYLNSERVFETVKLKVK